MFQVSFILNNFPLPKQIAYVDSKDIHAVLEEPAFLPVCYWEIVTESNCPCFQFKHVPVIAPHKIFTFPVHLFYFLSNTTSPGSPVYYQVSWLTVLLDPGQVLLCSPRPATCQPSSRSLGLWHESAGSYCPSCSPLGSNDGSFGPGRRCQNWPPLVPPQVKFCYCCWCVGQPPLQYQ